MRRKKPKGPRGITPDERQRRRVAREAHADAGDYILMHPSEVERELKAIGRDRMTGIMQYVRWREQ